MVWLQAAFVATVFSSTGSSGAGETVLLDFYADWCGPCRAMQPSIDALVEQGCPVRKVNIDRHPELARKFGVGPIPCYVMLVDGQEVDRVVGGTSLSRLRRMWALASDPRPRKQSSLVLAQLTGGQAGPPVALPAVESTPPMETSAQQPAQTQAAAALPDWRTPASAWTPREEAGATLDAALIAASVRLRIEDDDGHSCGSGTIIDARGGEALILTCGHIFRDSQGKGRIEVDLFGPGGVQRVAGNLISCDYEKGDVGLISIRTPGPVTVARVAPPGYRIAAGSPVISVGCNNGDRPTARRSRVTSLDKFLGPPNLQVAGLPVEGRSGGGLFSDDGLVIGVCNAADPTDKEGLFAALDSIHAELDRAQLSFICKPDDPGSVSEPVDAVPPTNLATVDPPPLLPERMPGPSELAGATALPAALAAAPAAATPLSIEEQAALDEIRRRLHEGAEVICIVRSRRDPRANSEVIILDKVSPDFLKQLAAEAWPLPAEAWPQDPLMSTSLEIPRKRPSAGSLPGPQTFPPPADAAPAPRRLPAADRAFSTGGWRAR
jgi:thiol-disulfide isomerase/thioredoxin